MSLSRIRGSLLGLAIGDAVGTTNEFSHRPAPVSDMVGGGPFRLAPGEWTDDTSMALCLADSLIECKGFDPRDQMERYVRWWRSGYNSVRGCCFDIGNTTLASLRRFLATGDPMSGNPALDTAGNGSLMRLAPVPLYFRDDEELAAHYAAESSKTTHAAPQAVEACRYFARLICRAVRGCSKPEIIAKLKTDPASPIAHIANQTYLRKPISALVPSGYVVESLEAALWCFANTADFREGCLMAANLGGDADTIAAIYGQLAGAHYGEEGLPPTWVRRLAWADRIRDRADRIFAAC